MKSKKSRKRTPSPDCFGPRSKKRKEKNSQDDNDGDDGFDQEMTEEALREMMYEEAHHYRRNLRGKQADIDDGRFMKEAAGGDSKQRKEEESRQEEAELRNELMDQNILREVMESPLKKTKYN